MNFIVSWILKYSRSYNKYTNELEFDEVNSFYLFLYIQDKLEYRNIFDHQLTKLCSTIKMIQENLQSCYPMLFDHIMEQNSDQGLFQYFTNSVMTIFICDLQRNYPEEALRIFDTFLIEGEILIMILLIKMIHLSEQKLLDLYDTDLSTYMQDQIIKDIINQNLLNDLLDVSQYIRAPLQL